MLKYSPSLSLSFFQFTLSSIWNFKEIRTMFIKKMYHFVWIAKYRHNVFVEPYNDAMKAIIHKIGYEYNFDIQELDGWIRNTYCHLADFSCFIQLFIFRF